MKKVFLLSALLGLFALTACDIGNFDPNRDRLYGKSEMLQLCEDEPSLCNGDGEEW